MVDLKKWWNKEEEGRGEQIRAHGFRIWRSTHWVGREGSKSGRNKEKRSEGKRGRI